MKNDEVIAELYEKQQELLKEAEKIGAELFIRNNVTASDYYHKWFKIRFNNRETYYLYVEEVYLRRKTLVFQGMGAWYVDEGTYKRCSMFSRDSIFLRDTITMQECSKEEVLKAIENAAQSILKL